MLNSPSSVASRHLPTIRGGTADVVLSRLRAIAVEKAPGVKSPPWTDITPIRPLPPEPQGSPVAGTCHIVLSRVPDGEFTTGRLMSVHSSRLGAAQEAHRLQLDTQAFVYGVFTQVGETEVQRRITYRTLI